MLYVLRFYTYLPKTINRIDLVNYFEEARYQKGILFAIYSFNEYQMCCNDTDFSKAYVTWYLWGETSRTWLIILTQVAQHHLFYSHTENTMPKDNVLLAFAYIWLSLLPVKWSIMTASYHSSGQLLLSIYLYYKAKIKSHASGLKWYILLSEGKEYVAQQRVCESHVNSILACR